MAVGGPTSFFEQQDLARRNSRRLIWLFALGVLVVVVCLNLVVITIYTSQSRPDSNGDGLALQLSNQAMPELLGIIGLTSLGTGSIIGLASLGKTAALSSGGSVIAESLGGRLIDPLDVKDPLEKRLLNVVEEMALASGVPVPPVYLMDQETGINAFAAGFQPTDAVIGVTRGTLESLNRDQLQGVIAHEFSHILNGDMRLNIRMIGLLYGLLFLGLMGRTILRVLSDISYRTPRRSSSNDKDNKGNPLAIIYVVAISLFVLGYVGFFMGRLIQAALSRQREFLADSSAVQFTRNPEGIAGALKAIGGWANHSAIQSPESMETAHMFFGDAVKRIVPKSPFATHPPLEVRIRRLDPNWDGQYPAPEKLIENAHNTEADRKNKKPKNPLDIPGMPKIPGGMAIPPIMAGLAASETVVNLPRGVESSLAKAGNPSIEQFGYANSFLDLLPDAVHELTHDPLEASCVVLWLLKPNGQQVASMPEPYHHEFPRVQRMLPEELRSYPVDLSKIIAPAIRRLTVNQLETLLSEADKLIMADNRINMTEWLVRRMLRNQLRRSKFPVKTSRHDQAMSSTAESIALVLSAIAWAGQGGGNTDDQSAASESLKAALPQIQKFLPDTSAVTLLPKSDIEAVKLDAALARLLGESAQIRLSVIRAAADVIQSDQEITKREFDVIRVLADSLGCPLPPLQLMA